MCHLMSELILDSIVPVHIKKKLYQKYNPYKIKYDYVPFCCRVFPSNVTRLFLYYITSECPVSGHVNGLR